MLVAPDSAKVYEGSPVLRQAFSAADAVPAVPSCFKGTAASVVSLTVHTCPVTCPLRPL